MNPRIVLICAAALLCGCPENESSPPMTEITGTVTYNEGTPPPPGAALEIVFEDLSRTPAEELMRTVQRVATRPPYTISIWFDRSRIVASHRYNIRASITANGAMLFQSDANPVLGPGNVLRTDIVLRPASGEIKATAPSEQLRGMYSYFADAGWFVECLTGRRLPVAQERDNAALESAYSKAKDMAGAPLLATVHGRIEPRTPMEGDLVRKTLIVEKFISIEPRGCSGPSSTAALENTYWKLTTLFGKPVETTESAREIHFVLHQAGLRLAGFSGCNSVTGTYRLEGEKIQFQDLAGTLMACPNILDIEREIHEMFSNVARWKISGETLQLSDASGGPLATFESRYMN